MLSRRQDEAATARHVISRIASCRYRATPTDLCCGHQNPLTLPSRELRLKWVIGPSGSLVPRAWNNLPGSIQATKTLPAFKKQLKLHLLHNSEHYTLLFDFIFIFDI